MKNILDMTKKEMGLFFRNMGEKTFRGKQVFKQIYSGAQSFDEMTELPLALREDLTRIFGGKAKDAKEGREKRRDFGTLEIADVQRSKKNETVKYLLKASHGCALETVFMKYRHGNSLCVSSQVGCRMGCDFCASTLEGLERNLTAGEMVEQVLLVQRERGERISHVVVMGMGEPLDNLENLFSFVEILHDEDGLNISLRNITVSTCGLIPEMRKLRENYPQVNLAVSLHGATNKLRSSIMPINKKYDVDRLIGECRIHNEETGRRVTFEYALIEGVNDGETAVRQLAEKLRGMNCHVNLISMNPVEEREFQGTGRKKAQGISRFLNAQGIPTTVRRELGRDIEGACGQLRRKLPKNDENPKGIS